MPRFAPESGCRRGGAVEQADTDRATRARRNGHGHAWPWLRPDPDPGRLWSHVPLRRPLTRIRQRETSPTIINARHRFMQRSSLWELTGVQYDWPSDEVTGLPLRTCSGVWGLSWSGWGRSAPTASSRARARTRGTNPSSSAPTLPDPGPGAVGDRVRPRRPSHGAPSGTLRQAAVAGFTALRPWGSRDASDEGDVGGARRGGLQGVWIGDGRGTVARPSRRPPAGAERGRVVRANCASVAGRSRRPGLANHLRRGRRRPW